MATPTLVRDSRATRSTIALKLLMAVTGLIFVGFVLAHMYGNLKVFEGQQAFDLYAHHLRTIGEPILPFGGLLWVTRAVLLASLAGHAYAAFALWSRAHQARNQRYAVRRAVASTLSSKTMRWGGLALLLFVVFHILHLTTGTIDVSDNPESSYVRMVRSFEPGNWWVAVIYLLAIGALAMHLRHGVWSASQTLGLTNTERSRRAAQLPGLVLAVVIAGGFALVPLAILFGVVSA